MAMDAIHGQAPSRESTLGHPVQGMRKAMVYGGVFMGSLYALGAVGEAPLVRWMGTTLPVLSACVLGALAFPLLKTIIETFDGSPPFFRRARRNYRDPLLFVRGAVVGAGAGLALVLQLSSEDLPRRAWFGFGLGALAYAGIDILRDFLASARGRGQFQRPRYYVVHALLGGFIGAAIGFYLDQSQVSVVVAKFHRYLAAGRPPELFDIYPLVSKWGHLDLGSVTGGAGLFFAESLAGVISWSTAAWLFAINRTFMRAYFWKDATPIRELFTKRGMTQVAENMIQVLRWGLWMSPIINSFLRPMGTPTWYNQDGAIRTTLAIFQDSTLGPDAFRAWSLQVFIYLLAYDAVRILIWLDHMGLRVATLVNLSFLGMDKLEQRLARFLAPAATARCIPEAVKRFTTWGPLLIPFYIPRGQDWDRAWSTAEAIRGRGPGGLLPALVALPVPEKLLLLAGSILAGTAVFATTRRLRNASAARTLSAKSLGGPAYEVSLREDGELVSRVPTRDYDVSRRSYDLLDPAGRTLFVVDLADGSGRPSLAWPVVGNFPVGLADASRFETDWGWPEGRQHQPWNPHHCRDLAAGCRRPGGALDDHRREPVGHGANDQGRPLPGMGPQSSRGRPRSHPVQPAVRRDGVRRRASCGTGLGQARQGHGPPRLGPHAAGLPDLADRFHRPGPERLDAEGARDAGLLGGARHPAACDPRSDRQPAHRPDSARPGIVSGPPPDRTGRRQERAIDLIRCHLPIDGPIGKLPPPTHRGEALHPIGHGEIPPGTPLPYFEFSDDGRRLAIRTPFTPRPFDHTMSNGLGHVIAVTNRGLHTTSSVNSQQNRLTPDWPDIVTREVPGEAFYLYDPDAKEWFSPTYQPLNDPAAVHEVEFGVDGTATFRMTKGPLETELTVFVPPDEPLGVYLLTVRNHAATPRRLRVAAYFQMVLAGQPEYSGPLMIRADRSLGAVFFENPRNTFRTGPAFVAISRPIDRVETDRGRFFGGSSDLAHPYAVELGEPDDRTVHDPGPSPRFSRRSTCPRTARARSSCSWVRPTTGSGRRRRSASTGIPAPRFTASKRPGGGGSA